MFLFFLQLLKGMFILVGIFEEILFHFEKFRPSSLRKKVHNFQKKKEKKKGKFFLNASKISKYAKINTVFHFEIKRLQM